MLHLVLVWREYVATLDDTVDQHTDGISDRDENDAYTYHDGLFRQTVTALPEHAEG